MARVITVSTVFPSYHPRAGEPTYFVEKIYNSIYGNDWSNIPSTELYYDIIPYIAEVKHTTIRAGHRWKVGDWFSPRVWSGVPYRSKQIQFAPDLQVKKIWDFQITCGCFSVDKKIYSGITESDHEFLEIIALNDGLSYFDFIKWLDFSKSFSGQIICWNENIEY